MNAPASLLIGAFSFLSENYRNHCLAGREWSRKYYGAKLKETLRVGSRARWGLACGGAAVGTLPAHSQSIAPRKAKPPTFTLA
jgi:hypothetical protein